MGGDEMKKRIIALIVLIIFATIYSCLAVGCTLGYEKASEQRFVEYFDKNGKARPHFTKRM